MTGEPGITDKQFAKIMAEVTGRLIFIAWILGMIVGWFIRGVF